MRKYTISVRYRNGYKFIMFRDIISFSTLIYFRISPRGKRITLRHHGCKPINIPKKEYGGVIKDLKNNILQNFFGKFLKIWKFKNVILSLYPFPKKILADWLAPCDHRGLDKGWWG